VDDAARHAVERGRQTASPGCDSPSPGAPAGRDAAISPSPSSGRSVPSSTGS